MKIPNTFKIEKTEHILLLIAGKQEASFHEIFDGKIDYLSTCKVEKPHYSDNEGHFKVRSGGKVIRSGSVRELDDSIVINDFLKKLKDHIKKNINVDDYESVYFTVPSHMENIIVESLSVKLKNKIQHQIDGNFFKHKPLDVLKKFSTLNKKESSSKVPFIKEEARKILKKSRQARKVIKGDPKNN